MVTSAGWPSLHVDDVGLVHLDFGGDDRHVGQRHQRAAGRILDADDDRLAFAHRQVGDHAVVGCGVSGLLQDVGGVRQVGAVLRDVAFGGILLRLGLGDARLGLRQAGLGGLPGSFLAVVFRLRDQCVFDTDPGRGSSRVGRVRSRTWRGSSRPWTCSCAASAATASVRAASSEPGWRSRRPRTARFPVVPAIDPSYPVAFLDVKPGDLAEGVGADVDVSLRLDFSRCADNRSQVLACRFAGLHRDHAFAALVNGNTGNRQRRRRRRRCRSVFSFQCSLFPVSRRSRRLRLCF